MKIGIAEAIQRTVEHREIFHDEMLHVMRQIMRGELTPAQIAGFIIGLRVKKETVGEIAAAAQVMREFATMVPLKDTRTWSTWSAPRRGAHTNISTAAPRAASRAPRLPLQPLGVRAAAARAAEAPRQARPHPSRLRVDRSGIGFIFAPATIRP
jgi:anthranilate phosphoribosyltransferase